MIELQRARLLAAKGNGAPTQNGQPVRKLLPGQSPGSSGAAAHIMQTPQQAAAAAVRAEELQMQRFFHKLQARDDTRPDAVTGPTVPTALTRRVLQQQGVGYLDDTVAAVISASADRFLATVLHQAAACRDQRLKGAELAKEAARHRKRHVQQYEADSDDRQRRKDEKLAKREKANLAAIEAAEVLRKSGKTPGKAVEGTPKSKKKKKAAADDSLANGRKPKQKQGEDDDDDDASYDSVDEEEDYYRNYYGDKVGSLEDEEEEDDEMLILRDVARPLEAWDFHLTGKEGMYQRPADPEDESNLSDEDDVSLEIADGVSQDAIEMELEKSANSPPPKGNGEDKKTSSAPTTPA